MTDMRGRNKPEDVNMGATGKIIGAAIVLAVIAGVAVYNYEAGTFTRHSHQMVASNQTTQQQQP